MSHKTTAITPNLTTRASSHAVTGTRIETSSDRIWKTKSATTEKPEQKQRAITLETRTRKLKLRTKKDKADSTKL
jgi:hypothetical protein